MFVYNKKDLGNVKKWANVQFDFICNGDIHIGNAGGREYFKGKIRYIEVYKEAMSQSQVKERFTKPLPIPMLPLNEVSKQCGGANILRKTIDGRQCVSPCTRNAMPPSENAPEPPEQAKIA